MDYRSRTGHERRERMRSILIQSALIIYCKHGINGSVIEDLIRTAGVSRGTFYNYFKTNEEIFEAVSTAVSNELIGVVNPLIVGFQDPAARVSCGVRLCLGIGAQYRQIALFINRGGSVALQKNLLLNEYLPRDLAQGIACGRFKNMDPQLAFDLVVGPVLAGFYTLSMDETKQDEYIEDLSISVLQSLGVSKDEAREISKFQIKNPQLSDDSLIVQTFKHTQLNETKT